MSHSTNPTHYGTPSEPTVTPEELAQTRKDIAIVFDLLTATSLPELETALSKHLADGAHFGPTVARIVEEQRTKLGGASRPA